jgi:hypothetical protein
MQLVQHSDPKAPFRGSLVDDNIFSIDMKDWGLKDLESEYRIRQLKRSGASDCEEIRKTGTE